MTTATARTVAMHGKPLDLTGNEVRVGQKAADFVAVDNGLKPMRLADLAEPVLVLSAVPSLDTSVCSLETKRFNDEAQKLGPDVKIVTISMDLPFAQKRWCGAEGAHNVVTLSDHRDASFGTNYGVLIKDLRLLARCVFVVGRDRKIEYIQLVDEISKEPDYGAVLSAVAKARG